MRLPKVDGAALTKTGMAQYTLTVPDGRTARLRRMGRGRWLVLLHWTYPGPQPRFVTLSDAARAALMVLHAEKSFALEG